MKKIVSFSIVLAFCIISIFALSGCNNSDKPDVTGEGVYGDYIVISIDDYIDIVTDCAEYEAYLEACQWLLEKTEEWTTEIARLETEMLKELINLQYEIIDLYEKLEYWKEEHKITEKLWAYAYANGMLTEEEKQMLEERYQLLQAR